MLHAAAPARRRTTRKVRSRLHSLIWAAGAVLAAAIVAALTMARTGGVSAPDAPSRLSLRGPSGPVAAGGSTDGSTAVLAFWARAGSSPALPQVEVAASRQAFPTRPTAQGEQIAGGARVFATVRVMHLRNGLTYRWRARLVGRDGRASRWVSFGGHGHPGVFTVDLTPPAAPLLTSPTHPDPTAWYTATLATVVWAVPADADGIAGYSYALDHHPGATPPERIMTRATNVGILIPSDGQWYLHVRARDRAGNWGAATTYPLRIDRHPAAFANVAFAHTSFDPDLERLHVAITLTGRARLSAQILDQYTGQPVRTLDLGASNGAATLLWNGRDDRGRPAPEGPYRFLITATDPYGQQTVADYSWIYITRRRLVVSLSKQRLVAYDGTQAVRTTLVTTGNRALPTPLGTFHIIEKLHPFTFISPWPPGSPYYYAPSPVNYALMFDWNGFYIHDAPWRTFFGPGSNAKLGTPGQNLTGTHGCVNVPADFAAWLYNWAPVGTVVQVVR